LTTPQRPTLTEIANDLRGLRFRNELRTSWAIAVLYRLPSLPLVWLSARLGLSPGAVTLAALGLALSLPMFAVGLPIQGAVWAVALGGALFQVLDCVDGTLARITQATSRRGGDLDFLVDMAQWGLLYGAIGMLADRTLGTGWSWTAVAMVAAWLRLYARTVRDRLDQRDEQSAPGPLRPAQLPATFVTGLSGLIPFLALSGGALWLAVTFLLLYSVLDTAEGLLPLFRPDRA